jgi:hypothetical protein
MIKLQRGPAFRCSLAVSIILLAFTLYSSHATYNYWRLGQQIRHDKLIQALDRNGDIVIMYNTFKEKLAAVSIAFFATFILSSYATVYLSRRPDAKTE